MKTRHIFLILIVCILGNDTLCAQKLKLKKPRKKKTETINFDSLSATQAPTVNLEKEEDEEIVKKKKKRTKKNVYFGMKTRKARISRRSGSKQLYEEFYYLQESKKPNQYVREKYYYDPEDRKVKFSSSVNKEGVLILHGPFKRYLDGQLVSEGIFYVGTKHGRWMEYFSNDVLKNKEKFYRGWPKESEITYHDQEATKVKEVLPIKYGKKEGKYYYFHDNGVLGVSGTFENDRKIGVWKEYYKYRRNRRNRKKEVQYGADGFDSQFSPFILKEWSQEGKLIYDRETHRKRLNQS